MLTTRESGGMGNRKAVLVQFPSLAEKSLLQLGAGGERAGRAAAVGREPVQSTGIHWAEKEGEPSK